MDNLDPLDYLKLAILYNEEKIKDIVLYMEIADTINSSDYYAQLLSQKLREYLSSSRSYVRLNCIILIDFLTQNCNMEFHHYLLNQQFKDIAL